MKIKRYLEITGITILVARVLTYIAIYFIGNTPTWNKIYSDQWNHYQLGIVILIFAFLFRKKLRQLPIIYGIGTGLILDEITDILKIFFPMPYHFRDSLGDLLLIIVTYLLFCGLVLFKKK